MKNNIKIKSLTQVHIGSGETLQKDTDFIIKGSGDDSYIYVIDPDKVGKIIGTDQRALDQWIASIEKGDTSSFFDLFLGKAQPLDYSKRRITNYSGNYRGMTLKECLHDGRGIPYIPGSSLKGAIRTAIISFIADKTPEVVKEKLVDVFSGKKGKYIDEFGNKFNSVEGYFLGDTPNENLTRFIRVGDAFFDRDSEIAVTQVSLNQRPSHNSLIDISSKQPVEAIGADEESTFALAIDKDKFEEVYSKRNDSANARELNGMRKLPDECSSIPGLFHIINEHTKRLVEFEIDYWKNLPDYSGSDDYIDSMNEVLDYIKSCKDGECVLRVGQASGWRFITGAWTEALANFYDKVVPSARYNSSRYVDFDFPKTRRIDDQSFLFGFVKLHEI